MAFDAQEEQGRELRALNDALLVSSVRQHELTEQANQATVAGIRRRNVRFTRLDRSR